MNVGFNGFSLPLQSHRVLDKAKFPRCHPFRLKSYGFFETAPRQERIDEGAVQSFCGPSQSVDSHRAVLFVSFKFEYSGVRYTHPTP